MRALGLFHPRVALPLAIVSIWVIIGGVASWFTPHDPYTGDLTHSLLPPFWTAGGSLSFPLGTDLQGHDILSELIAGARISLVVTVAALSIAAGTGTALGLVAGYYGGWIDVVLMRLSDFIAAFPVVLAALLLGVVFGSSVAMVIAIITLLLWSRFARIVRSEALSIRGRDFVLLAKVAGASSLRILVRHILPNVLHTVVVMATLQVGQAILTEAALSFLGVGVPPPNPSWGSMVSQGVDYLQIAWWIAFFPGFAILLVVLALTLIGDWLRNALDPRLRTI